MSSPDDERLPLIGLACGQDAPCGCPGGAPPGGAPELAGFEAGAAAAGFGAEGGGLAVCPAGFAAGEEAGGAPAVLTDVRNCAAAQPVAPSDGSRTLRQARPSACRSSP